MIVRTMISESLEIQDFQINDLCFMLVFQALTANKVINI